MKEELELKRQIRESKRQLQCHKMVLLAVSSTEKHMRRVPLDVSSEADFGALSLTCEELANAQFLLQNCHESPMSADAKKVSLKCMISHLILILVTHIKFLLTRFRD